MTKTKQRKKRERQNKETKIFDNQPISRASPFSRRSRLGAQARQATMIQQNPHNPIQENIPDQPDHPDHSPPPPPPPSPVFLYFVCCVGGGFGSLLRHGVGRAFSPIQTSGSSLPYSIIVVNVVGCFLMGFLSVVLFSSRFSLIDRHPAAWRAFLLSGLMGGLTTMSGFSYESAKLFMGNSPLMGAVNLIGENLLGFLAFFLGRTAAGPADEGKTEKIQQEEKTVENNENSL